MSGRIERRPYRPGSGQNPNRTPVHDMQRPARTGWLTHGRYVAISTAVALGLGAFYFRDAPAVQLDDGPTAAMEQSAPDLTDQVERLISEMPQIRVTVPTNQGLYDLKMGRLYRVVVDELRKSPQIDSAIVQGRIRADDLSALAIKRVGYSTPNQTETYQVPDVDNDGWLGKEFKAQQRK